jgi:N-formylglutamate deformylase
MTAGLALHIPHSSSVIPSDERTNLVLNDTQLARELLRMTDAFTDDLFPPTHFETARVVFPVSRLICDVERFPEDADEPMARRGMGAVYVKTSDGAPLRRDLARQERARVMQRWYVPHHEALTTAVDGTLRDRGACTLIDCHSFGSVPLPHEPDQDPLRPDICIGTDPYHTPSALTQALVSAASARRFSVLVDRPFAGALVPMKHYRTDAHVRAAMIEVNRKLYMDERTGNRLERFAAIREAVDDMLTEAASFGT